MIDGLGPEEIASLRADDGGDLGRLLGDDGALPSAASPGPFWRGIQRALEEHAQTDGHAVGRILTKNAERAFPPRRVKQGKQSSRARISTS